MEAFQTYLTGDEYCSICLRTSTEARLVLSACADFFVAVQMSPASSYLCAYCQCRLRVFQRMKILVQRSQYWLYNVHQVQSDLCVSNQESLLAELLSIKKDVLEKDTQPPMSVNCVAVSFSHLRGLWSFDLDSKNKSEDEVDQTTKSNNDIGAVGSWLDIDATQSLPAKYTEPKDAITSIDEISIKYRKKKVKVMAGIAKKELHKKKLVTSNLRKRTMNKTNGTVVLDEYDDLKYMLSSVMKEKVKAIMLTEDQYRLHYSERQNKPSYTRLPFKCTECAIAFHWKHHFETHMAKHSLSRGNFVCHFCSTHHRTKTELTVHICTHLRRYACTVCAHTCYNRQDVTNHYFNSHTTLRFHCRYCGLQTKGPFLVKEHIMAKHRDVRGKHEECPVCKKMVSARNRWRHAQSHLSAPAVSCHICSRSYKNRLSLQQHIYKCHRDQHGSSQQLIECPICKKAIPRQRKSHHLRLHEAPNICRTCCRQFSSKYTLDKHMRYMHTERNKKFECNECGAKYKDKPNVRRHIEFVHFKLRGVPCTVCGRLFSATGDMKHHLRNVHEKHLVLRDKLCDICGKSFKTNKILEAHRRTHTNERPYCCKECGNTFRQLGALITHRKTMHLKMTLGHMKDKTSVKENAQETCTSCVD